MAPSSNWGMARTVVGALEQAGAEVMMFADIWGEPKQKQVDAATTFVRAAGAGLVVCLGGGSAMDVGKIAATLAATDGSARVVLGVSYALWGRAPPAAALQGVQRGRPRG